VGVRKKLTFRKGPFATKSKQEPRLQIPRESFELERFREEVEGGKNGGGHVGVGEVCGTDNRDMGGGGGGGASHFFAEQFKDPSRQIESGVVAGGPPALRNRTAKWKKKPKSSAPQIQVEQTAGSVRRRDDAFYRVSALHRASRRGGHFH